MRRREADLYKLSQGEPPTPATSRNVEIVHEEGRSFGIATGVCLVDNDRIPKRDNACMSRGRKSRANAPRLGSVSAITMALS